MKFIVVALFFLLPFFGFSTNYFIAPSGNDITGDGSIGNPWATLFKATTVVTVSGDVINVTAGTYTEPNQCILAVGVSILGAGKISVNINCTWAGGDDEWLGNIQLLSGSEGTNGNQTISGFTMDGGLVARSAIVIR